MYPCLPLAAASLGKQPGQEALKGVPVFSKDGEEGPGRKKDEAGDQGTSSRVACRTSTLLSLLVVHDNLGSSQKATRVWLGEGLGAIPKRVHERMVKWEYMDMQDFHPHSASDQNTWPGRSMMRRFGRRWRRWHPLERRAGREWMWLCVRSSVGPGQSNESPRQGRRGSAQAPIFRSPLGVLAIQ